VASPRPFLELSVAEWLDELAGPQASPGGGSAAALSVAMAAAVLTMTARVSGNAAAAAQAEALRARATPLAQVDAEIYAAALEAREAAADLTPERRDWQIGQAFARAVEPPLEIARTGADVAELAAELAEVGDPRVRADAQAAAALAAAAARAAAALVAINLTAVAGDPRAAEAERLAAAAQEAADRSRA